MLRQKTLPNWSITDIWNELLVAERKPEKRSYIRASEIGSPFLDRYLKMKGVRYSNPYTARVLRIFDVGRIFEKEVIERIFKLLGLWISTQRELKIENKDLLPVIGHHDPKVGGKIKVRQALKKIKSRNVSDWMRARVLVLLAQLRAKYPKGLKILTTEIKTVNSRAFWAKKNQDPKTGFFKGYDHQKLQLWTYLKADNQDEGRLIYVSKDDLTLHEAKIFLNDRILEQLWYEDIGQMSHYFKNNIEPNQEPYIVFNKDEEVWEFNWRIKRSNYFTRITGFNDIEAWERKYLPELKKKNSKPCKKCGTVYQLQTLNKNQGHCARCATALGIRKNGGENNHER